MSELLENLAGKLGISASFTYGGTVLKTSVASDELLRFFIESLGYSAKDDLEIQHSLERIEKKRWQRALEAIYVVVQDNLLFDLVLSKKELQDGITVLVATENSDEWKELNVNVAELEDKTLGRVSYIRSSVTILDGLDLGYYHLKVKTNKAEYKALMAVAPKQCYALNKNGKDKLFGFALQLYSVRSKRNWGVGDFTDLSRIVDLLADSGGDVIGLNPLNVLLHDYPENASPYASISRLFLNPIYIDVENVPFYQEDDCDQNLIQKMRDSELIDYTGVYTTKINALQRIYQRVLDNKKSDYFKLFEEFKQKEGADLNRLTVFQAISHAIASARKVNSKADLKKLEALLKTSFGEKIEKFAAENEELIDFFKFLQFEADRQLKLVEQKIKERNLIIGLYRDLPVGVSKDSAEVWCDRYLYMQDSGAGAPPDTNFPTGQKWGLGAFNPFELKERGYKPFIQILRANMKYAGAIRIDHVMGLSRLFLIPDDKEDGTYLAYNAQDLFNIVALESCLNRCVVVGECIGNVADGFQDMLTSRNIYSLGVLWNERNWNDNASFKAPHDYEQKYFASVGTHDMPPLKAWWFGEEISCMKRLQMFTEDEAVAAYKWREHERWALLSTLDREGVWPEDRNRQGDYLFGEGYPEGIEEAVHSYMAKTRSEVLLLQPEDIFQSMKIQNLPGTDVDKYPNWRTKLPVNVEDIASSEAYQRNLKAVKKWR